MPSIIIIALKKGTDFSISRNHPSNAARGEAVSLPAAAARGRQQRAPRAVPVAAKAADGAAVRGPRDLELVPLHRGLGLDDSCKSKSNFHYRLPFRRELVSLRFSFRLM